MEGTAALSKDLRNDRSWREFKYGSWCDTIDVRDFIVRNVTPYTGDEAFLVGSTGRTKAVWAKLQPYFEQERKKGVLAVEAKTPSTVLAHKAGYIDRDNEVIVGLQIRSTVQASDLSVRRPSHGRGRPEGGGVRA
jgi:formate C-acetyltransferase